MSADAVVIVLGSIALLVMVVFLFIACILDL